MSKLRIQDGAKKYFYVAKSEEEYRAYVLDINTKIDSRFLVKQERIDENVKIFCGKMFYCVEANLEMKHHKTDVLKAVNSSLIIPRGVLAYKIPLDKALRRFPEYFI